MTNRQPGRGDGVKKAGMVVRAFRLAVAGADSDDIDAKVGPGWERLDDKAERRGQRLADQLLGNVNSARTALAKAEADLRGAKPADKAAARRTRNDARAAAERAKRAARRAGLNP